MGGILMIITIIAIILGLGGFIAYKSCYAEQPYTDGDIAEIKPTREHVREASQEEENKGEDKVTKWSRFKKGAVKCVKWTTAPLWVVPNAFFRSSQFRMTAYIPSVMMSMTRDFTSFMYCGVWLIAAIGIGRYFLAKWIAPGNK